MRYMRTTNEGEKSVTLRNAQKRHASKRRPTNGEVCLDPTIMAAKRRQTESPISRARFLCGLQQAAKAAEISRSRRVKVKQMDQNSSQLQVGSGQQPLKSATKKTGSGMGSQN